MNIIRQNIGEPYYRDMLWNKPVNKALAGKLLIIGGNKFGINSPSEAYSNALKNGAGQVKVVLPDVTKSYFGKQIPKDIEFAKSSPSGSFSKESLNDILSYIDWADLVLLAGDFSHSSETGILIEQLLVKSNKHFVITRDAIDYFTKTPKIILYRPKTTIAVSFAQLQSLMSNSGNDLALKFSMPNNVLIDYLEQIKSTNKCNIIVARHNYIYVLADGKLSITDYKKDIQNWRLSTAVNASIWLMQNPSRPFEALTTALI